MQEFSIKALAELIRAHIDTGLRFCNKSQNRDPTPISPAASSEQSFTGVSTDSRTVNPGDCFFAIPGENFDGADFVADAFAKGAACAVVSRDAEDRKCMGKPILKVKDTIKALGDFAAEYGQQMNFKVVAITGSVGKTTVRHITYHVLSRHYCVYQAPQNFNNQIGLPLTLLGADPDHEIVVAELGTNHPGEIAYLTRIAQPNVAVVTNVYAAHLEGFGDLRAIMQEKLSIAEGLSPEGVLIINADLAEESNYQSPIADSQIITFGESDSCDYRVSNIAYDGASSSFAIDGTRVSLPLPGPGNVENALAAWAVCSQFDLTADAFAQALRTLSPVPMRAEVLQVGSLTVLNDCYNANPASTKNALDILANLSQAENRRPVFISGDMAELGQQSAYLHAQLGASIAQAKIQLLLAVGKFAKTVADAATRTAEYDLQAVCFYDTDTTCDNLEKFIKDDDIILVKGSRVAKLEKVTEKVKELFE